MVYQSHLTKFVVFKALRMKTEEGVARKLKKVIRRLVAPAILQSDNGREFANKVIIAFCAKWKGMKIAQSQGFVERSNEDVENMIAMGIAENNTDDWLEGLSKIQLINNGSYHAGIKRSSYKVLFGCDMWIGLASTPLHPEMYEQLEAEEEFLKLLHPSENRRHVPENHAGESAVTGDAC